MNFFPLFDSSTWCFARTVISPRPDSYASRIPAVPQMIPPVGKSGPGTTLISSSTGTSGSSITLMIRSHTSRRLCGGIEVAIPTAIPVEPFTRRFGNLLGKTVGSSRVSS